MEELFVPFELAKELKEICFRDLCLRFWSVNSMHRLAPSRMAHFEYLDNSTHRVAAPLYDQVIDWFILKHDIHLIPRVYFDMGTFTEYRVMLEQRDKDLIPLETIMTPYYTERRAALNAGIKKAIELVKERQ